MKDYDYNFIKYENKYLQDIFKLYENSENTNRDENTWLPNKMDGILCFKKNELIGILPYEHRNLVLDEDKIIKVLWITGAHVDPGYRSQGIGSKCLKIIKDIYHPEINSVFVYRNDPSSLAYKWYKKNDFHHLLNILSFNQIDNDLKIFKKYNFQNYHIVSDIKEIKKCEKLLHECYISNIKYSRGSRIRSKNSWSENIAHNYYYRNYEYLYLLIKDESKIVSYALLGKTKFKDNLLRFEILDICYPNNLNSKKKIIYSIMNYAEACNIPELRIQLSNQDYLFNDLSYFGFKYRWQTNILCKILDYNLFFHRKICDIISEKKYRIVISINNLFDIKYGNGHKLIHFNINHTDFIKLIFNRISFNECVKDGRILIKVYNKDLCRLLNKTFKLKIWLYHQVDYI